MIENRYEGWSNYPTWCINLWLRNDRETYLVLTELAIEAKDESSLAKEIEEWVVKEMIPDLGCNLQSNLLIWAVGQVDWYEIAKEAWDDYRFLDDVEEVEEEELEYYEPDKDFIDQESYKAGNYDI